MKRRTAAALVAAGATIAAGAAATIAIGRAVRRLESSPDPVPLRTLDRPVGDVLVVESTDGTLLSTVTNGRGPTIVLGHGWTSDLRSWRLVADRLVAGGWRVISWDQRGHGDSTVGRSGFGIDQLGDDLAAVLRAHDVRDAIVAGHSMGGIGVQSFALRHPDVAADRVRGLVLVGTLARSVASLPFSLFESLLRSDLYERRRAGRSRLQRYIASRAFGDDVAPSVVERNREIFLDCPTSTVIGAAEPLVDFDLTGEVTGITIPALVLHGTADRIVPLSRGEELGRLLPDAELHTMEGVGHMIPLERPDEVVAQVRAFAAELDPSARVG